MKNLFANCGSAFGALLAAISMMVAAEVAGGGQLAFASRPGAMGKSESATSMFSKKVEQGKAVVRSLRGTAEYSVGRNEWKPVKVGAVFYSGTAIRTGDNTQVDLFLGVNGPALRITPNTILEIESLRYAGSGEQLVVETILSVPRGNIQANFKKASPDSRYEIKTAQTTSAIVK
jgi:hypothetical protein